VRPDGTTDHQTLQHTPEGIGDWIASIRRQFPERAILIALEQSHGALVNALREFENLELYPLNPKQLARYRESIYPSGSKDDPHDAELLARFLQKHRERLRPDAILDDESPSQAVTKGSFTVWTEPEDPMPGQQYKIMIQVKLNNELKRYPCRDLSGSIVGSDGYRDFFGGPTEPGYLPVKDNSVHYEALIVPGAAELVKDIINVESKILKEKQTIELVF
jgi:hypothetical protein